MCCREVCLLLNVTELNCAFCLVPYAPQKQTNKQTPKILAAMSQIKASDTKPSVVLIPFFRSYFPSVQLDLKTSGNMQLAKH